MFSSEALSYKKIHAVHQKVTGMLPHLREESEIKEAFSRMDHNGDGVVDLTDFLMWQERMQEGRANTDFWALQEVNTICSTAGKIFTEGQAQRTDSKNQI